VLIAIVVLIGQGVVWYSSQFWALFFLQNVQKLDVLTSSTIVASPWSWRPPSSSFWEGCRTGSGAAHHLGRYGPGLPDLPADLHGASQAARPRAVNYPLAVFLVFILVLYVAMV